MLTIDYTPQTGGVPRLLSSIVESTADHVDWRVITAAPGQPSDQVVRTNGVRGLPMATWKQSTLAEGWSGKQGHHQRTHVSGRAGSWAGTHHQDTGFITRVRS